MFDIIVCHGICNANGTTLDQALQPAFTQAFFLLDLCLEGAGLLRYMAAEQEDMWWGRSRATLASYKGPLCSVHIDL